MRSNSFLSSEDRTKKVQAAMESRHSRSGSCRAKPEGPKASLCSPGWPKTHCVAQANLEL